MFSRMKNSLNIHAVCWLCCDLRTKNLILYLLDLPLEDGFEFSHPCRHFRDTRHTTPRRVTAPGAPSINGHLLVEKSCPGYRQQWPSPPGCEKCPFCCVSASFLNETCINGRKSLDNWGLFTPINGVYICHIWKKTKDRRNTFYNESRAYLPGFNRWFVVTSVRPFPILVFANHLAVAAGSHWYPQSPQPQSPRTLPLARKTCAGSASCRKTQQNWEGNFHKNFHLGIF